MHMPPYLIVAAIVGPCILLWIAIHLFRKRLESVHSNMALLPLERREAEELARLLGDNKLIEAIKYYRDTTGLSLATAHNAAQVVRRHGIDGIMHPEMYGIAVVGRDIPPTRSGDWETEVRDLVEKGQMIPAIKAYRDGTGSTLQEASAAVEALRERLNPAARR